LNGEGVEEAIIIFGEGGGMGEENGFERKKRS